MQSAKADVENLDPQHFPNNLSASTTNTKQYRRGSTTNNNNSNSPGAFSHAGIENRGPNFSFSSSYTAARHNWQPSHPHQHPHQQPHHHPYYTGNNSISPRYAAAAAAQLNAPLGQANGEHTAFAVLCDEERRLGYGGKPNAIVRPIRRATEQQLAQEQERQQQQSLTGNANEGTHAAAAASAASVAPPPPQEDTQRRRHFADELNRKLRFLHQDNGARGGGVVGGGTLGGGGAAGGGLGVGGARPGDGLWTKSLDASKRDSPTKLSFSGSYGSQFRETASDAATADMGAAVRRRPLFVTTVPTGVFLPPPADNEMPLQAFLAHRIYAFSSHPVVYGCAGPFNPYYSNSLNNSNYQTGSSSDYAGSPYGGSTQRKSMAGFGKDSEGPPGKKLEEDFTVVNSLNPSNVLRSRSQQERQHQQQQQQAPSVDVAGGVHVTKEQFHQQIQQRRGKREAAPQEPYKNVMCDRRVVRGSNFVNAQLMCDSDPFDKAAELRRHHALRKKAQCRNQRNVLGTPPPVSGRRHEVIQTEKYLEELVQRPPDYSVDTQTDLFLERPPTPPYIPAKVGVDVGTEIAEGELFHFDAEAQPIIDVLVDACIEQSMLEVAHEQEIEELRRKQDEFLAHREAELAALRRLEAEDIKLAAEKERRERQEVIAQELDAEMQKGVTAAKLLQGHIASLVPEVLENLEPATDAAKKEQLIKTICPWLAVEVAEEVGHIVDSREILTVIIQEIIKQRAEIYAGYKDAAAPLSRKTLADEGEEEGEEMGGVGELATSEECEVCETQSNSEDETVRPPPPPPAKHEAV